MRFPLLLVTALALGGCKKNEAPQPEAKPADPVPLRCPAGSVVKAGACTQVVTAERVQAVAQQATRLDELGQLLGKADLAAAPIELLNGLRQLDAWKKLAATSASLGRVDQLVAALGGAVKELHAFKDGLGTTAGRLNNLKGELDKLMVESSTAQQLEDVRQRISSQVQGVVGPFEQQVQGALAKITPPLVAKLGDLGDLITGGCSLPPDALAGGSEQLKTLCGQAKDVFGKATTYLTEVKDKPAALFAEVTGELQSQLGELVDQETKTIVERAQTAVGDALKLPPRDPAVAAAPPSKPSAPTQPAPAAPAPAPTAPAKPAPATPSPNLLSALGQPCGAGDQCVAGTTCKSYYGIAGPAGPEFKSCEVPCDRASKACPAGSTCVTVADGPGSVCRPQ
jgi:uncharacterized protein YjbJ (UPF0337 family)